MLRKGDESGRLFSYLISVYEVVFGFIAADGVFADTSLLLLAKGMGAFVLAGVGLHFFVNLNQVDEAEYQRKSRTLWLGVLCLLGGLFLSVSISSDKALTSHLFFLVYLGFVVMSFIYFGVVRKVFLLGALAYGAIRLLAIMAGGVIAGQFAFYQVSSDVRQMVMAYVLFFMLCEFLRWAGSVKSTRFSILAGFFVLLVFLAGMFYSFIEDVDSIMTKLVVMILLLIIVWLVAFPPLTAVRNLKALPLLDIYPRSLASGVILTLIFYIIMEKNMRLAAFSLLPAVILLFQFRSTSNKGETPDEILP